MRQTKKWVLASLLLSLSSALFAQIPAGNVAKIIGGTGITVSPASGTGTVTVSSAGGGGSVSTVSVTTANGVSGAVANPTTTPAISLSLGAITPTSVAIGGGTALTTSNQTGTGNIVLANTPTLVTPNIGAATGTSLVLAGGGSFSNLGLGESNIATCTSTINPTAQIASVTLAANCTLVVGSGSAGKNFCLRFIQPATGGPFTVTFPANLIGYIPISPAASSSTTECGVWSAAAAAWEMYDPFVAAFISPAFTGVPTTPTASAATSTTQIATTAFAHSLLLKGVVTSAADTADSITITGVTTGSVCSFSPSSQTAAAAIPTLLPWVTVAANTVTLNYAATATAGLTFNVVCE